MSAKHCAGMPKERGWGERSRWGKLEAVLYLIGCLGLGETKPRVAWIRVGSWLTTGKICLMAATGIAGIAVAKQCSHLI